MTISFRRCRSAVQRKESATSTRFLATQLQSGQVRRRLVYAPGVARGAGVLVLDGLPALAGLIGGAPVLAVEQALDEPFDIGRFAQTRQVATMVFLADFNDVLVAVAHLYSQNYV